MISDFGGYHTDQIQQTPGQRLQPLDLLGRHGGLILLVYITHLKFERLLTLWLLCKTIRTSG